MADVVLLTGYDSDSFVVLERWGGGGEDDRWGGEGMDEVVRVCWGSWGMSSGKRVRLL